MQEPRTSEVHIDALRQRLRDAEHRLAFVRHYLNELKSHAAHGPEHEAAVQLTLAAEKRAMEEFERLRKLVHSQ